MSDVATKDWFKTMTISHAEGTSLLDYAKLSALAGAPLTYGSEGRASWLPKPMSSAGSGSRDHRYAAAERQDQTITLSDARFQLPINLPDFTAQAAFAALLRPIPLKVSRSV
jgi:hypothetical protein